MSLCKDNNLPNVNGRLDKGDFTIYSVNRRIVGRTAVVDYFLTYAVSFNLIDKFNVLDKLYRILWSQNMSKTGYWSVYLSLT